MPNLVLLAGVPGAGKSTFAKTFFDLKYAIVSSDAIRTRLAGSLREAHAEQISPWDMFYGEIGERLRHNVDVIADATFLTVKHRSRAWEVAGEHRADLHLVLFKNLMTASLRNAVRTEEDRVPGQVMSDMQDLYYDTLAAIGQEPYVTVTKIEDFI